MGGTLVSMVKEDMEVVIMGATLVVEESRKLLIDVELEVELALEGTVVMRLVDMADVEVDAEDVVVVVDGVEEVEGERVEVNDTVETNDGKPAVFAVPVAPPLDAVAAAPAPPPPFEVVAWLLVLGHKACTPAPFLKVDIMSFPGNCAFAQACFTLEVSVCRELAHRLEHGFPSAKSELLHPEIGEV